MGNPQYGNYPDMNQGHSDNRLHTNTSPNYPGQPQPPPNVVYVAQQNHAGSYCPVCNHSTNSYVVKATGNITWIWCIVLLFLTGICCWIPFICDACKEDQIRCAKCNVKKAVI